MRLVTAIVKPHTIEGIKDALQDVGVTGLTVSEVRGFGRQRGHTEVYRGAEYDVAFHPKIRVEVLCAADRAREVADAIVAVARTGDLGDGKVFVSEVEELVRVRTGEHGPSAL